MRLPKVKNKHTAAVQVSVNDLVPSGVLPPGPQKIPAGLDQAPTAQSSAISDAREEELALVEFHREQEEVHSTCKARGDRQQMVFKVPRRSVNPKVRAGLHVRRSDWSKRRLLCIALCKEDASRCPLAKLPQGFLRAFVNYVFSFLADGSRR
ncbi:nipblb [Symbiodinium natans]|uniref:Nipblb protein n=1 Tax=Symbiodinium natans TaxID=878477 RepID=A0A812MNI8_9DINO|nr:nipblb [Symbiodinium natans]